MSMVSRRKFMTLAALGALLPTGLARAQSLSVAEYPAEISALHFPATSHNVAGAFLRYWWEHGQLEIFGFPISEEFSENGRAVQYFERARFEYFPEHAGSRYEVQLGLLGREVAGDRTDPPFQPVAAVAESPRLDYFPETGHTLFAGFKTFWQNNNGQLNFGYPISEEFSENGRAMQYFERARFEYFPEHAGTPYEVQLGHLGRQVAEARGVAMGAAGRRGDATTWTPSLAQEIAARRAEEARQRQQEQAPEQQPVQGGPFMGVVRSDAVNIRSGPSTANDIVESTYARHIVHVVGSVEGENIDGDPIWHELARGGYISASLVERFTPPAPPRVWPGRWIDVNLSSFYITGYEGNTPFYSALITAGRDNRTPLGVFTINRRVRDETMDSATVGIPKGHPEYYYLEHVMFTQYITNRGHAIHGNYWVHPSRFGRFSSNGCVGLKDPDAEWFWNFAGIGTPVHIHF